MKTHTALLTFVLSAAVLAVAQSPSGSTGGQSATSTHTQTASNNSSNASATPLMSDNQNNDLLQSQIENALRNELTLSNSHVVVNVSAGSVDLSGTVGSSKDKQTAERIAQSFDGNRKLNDNLMIAGHGRSDLAPDHSTMNNSSTGNTQNPATVQGSNGSHHPPSTPAQR